ncbi:MAG: hypothetical protein RIK87_17515 [Fuerstiella sp.]
MRNCLILLIACTICHGATAEESSDDQIRKAVQAAIPWLEKGSAGSSKEHKCFTCHNHALPVMALFEAKQHGLSVDEPNLEAQLEHTLTFLKRGEQQYRSGKGQGGRVLTAGYALWALDAGAIRSDDITPHVASYILNDQADQDHWKKSGRRPPSDGNEFTTTYVALRALDRFPLSAHREQTQQRFRAAGNWAQTTPPRDTEDAVFRLRTLSITGSAPEVIRSAVDNLLQQQRSDGGWAQTSDMKSDAYATGTVLATLLQDGQLPSDHSAVRSGVQYLMTSQLEDGTWHVVTRADGFQPYYESGFPHGEDQFISIAASSWAVTALLRSLGPAKQHSDSGIGQSDPGGEAGGKSNQVQRQHQDCQRCTSGTAEPANSPER